MEMDFNSKEFEFFNNNYGSVYFLIQRNDESRVFVDGNYYGNVIEKKTRFSYDDNKKTCRFCNKKVPIIKFSKDEHIFPESIGNKCFVSKGNECDTCNEFFSIYENDLNVYLKAFLSIDGIVGHNGTKKYKSFDKTSSIKYENEKITIKETIGNEKAIVNEEEHTFIYPFDIPKYSPLKIYKSLLKMALAIMPKEVFDQYSILNDSLKDENKYFGFEKIFFGFYPGFAVSDFTVIGNKRKNDDKSLPSFVFFIMNNNFSFQIPLFSNDDITECMNKNYDFYPFPTPFDNGPLKEKIIKNIEINGTDYVEKHTENYTFHYDSAELNEMDDTDN